MRCEYVSWDEAVGLFERRGLPESTYQNLYEEEYILVPGPAVVNGDLLLDDHERTPWRDGTPEGATGYIVDGDLTVGGNLVDIDDGAAALIVLGDLRTRDVYLEGDVKLIVRGDMTAGTFTGYMTEKLVMIHGDLRTGVSIFCDEFCPDLVTGSLTGRVLAPGYLDLDDGSIGGLLDPAPDVPLGELLVPELLRAEGTGDDDGYAAFGIRGDVLRERVIAGLPLSRPV